MNQPLKINPKKPADFPVWEERVLEYWDKIDAFRRSVAERPEDKVYVFYDGPPFATGLPHYGHLLGSVMKDIVPRYWTMKGYKVERIWGWDCHGLPIENIIEKELDLKGGKKGIEELGIDKFNAACRSAILRFDSEWEKVIRRIGRWVDFNHSYKTMDFSYMESIWWGFKQLFDKDLVYQGRKVILYCPRCSTPLSNFEIAMDNSYKDVEDHSIVIKLKVKNRPNEFLLAWTTTPWTLIGNVALAVHPQALYLKVSQAEEIYFLAKDRLNILQGKYEILDEFTGNKLVGIDYEPLFDFLPTGDMKAFYVAAADFVSLDEGTGIVHTAAMYGEDDYQLAQKIKLPLIDMLDDQGKFMAFVKPIAGQFYKKAEKWIVEDLLQRNLMYHADRITHSYPFCYRCNTPLYYNAIPAWFINIQKLKPKLVENNQHINWYPGHLKHGRFGKGLETAPDWNISRSRYWGTPMPIWIGENTKNIRVIGSVDELKKWAVVPKQVENISDLHREFVDPIKVWVDDDKTEEGTKIPEVFDCWVESGSMSFAAEHYPFENKQKFESRFPAQYIVEYIAQTRAWFYTLHVMSTALFDKPAFENALTTGTIMAEDGTKMSKSKKNFPDPMEIINQYGVDSLRLYFASSPLMKTAQNVNFNRDAINDIRKKVLNIVWNVFKFYQLFDNGKTDYGYPEDPRSVLDKWLISLTQNLNKTVTQSMDQYDVVSASRALMEYVSHLSTWYLRRSRDRLRDGNSESLQVLRTALRDWALLMSPFAPFITEVIYQNLPGDKSDSIHLDMLPKVHNDLVRNELEDKMSEVRKAVEKIHAVRKVESIPLRQPCADVVVHSSIDKPKDNLLQVLASEVNVKKVTWLKADELSIDLNTDLTPELIAEGETRKLIRKIQSERKKLGLSVDQSIELILPSWPKDYEPEIKSKVLARSIKKGDKLKIVLISSKE